jgi:hypothetical protein
MNIITRMLIAPIVALTYFAMPATANADRVYYLVGVRHVYRIGTDKYFHATERQKIEQDYADEVSADNAHYQYQITHGGIDSTESPLLQSALQDLAAERETQLAALYEVDDSVRASHPSFNINVDGPYQVIGVDYHDQDNVQIWDNYTAYAPWPGYVSVGPNPYGWNYGYTYSPSLFIGAYNGWYGGWSGFGRPAFVGLYGYGGPMIVAGLSINAGFGFGIGASYGGFYSNPGLSGFYHSGPGYFGHDPFRGGYISGRRDPRAAMAGRAGYAAGASAVRSAQSGGYGNGIRAGARSTFAAGGARSTRAASGSGYAHSYTGAGSRTGTSARTGSVNRSNAGSRGGSGYAHSTTGAAGYGGSARTSSARSGSGGYARTSGARSGNSGAGRTSSARSSGSGGYARTSGVARSSGSAGRSSGVTRASSGGGRTSGGGQRSAPSRSQGGGSRGGGGGGSKHRG